MTIATSSPKATQPASAGGDAQRAPHRDGAQDSRQRDPAPSQRDLVRASLLRCPVR